MHLHQLRLSSHQRTLEAPGEGGVGAGGHDDRRWGRRWVPPPRRSRLPHEGHQRGPACSPRLPARLVQGLSSTGSRAPSASRAVTSTAAGVERARWLGVPECGGDEPERAPVATRQRMGVNTVQDGDGMTGPGGDLGGVDSCGKPCRHSGVAQVVGPRSRSTRRTPQVGRPPTHLGNSIEQAAGLLRVDHGGGVDPFGGLRCRPFNPPGPFQVSNAPTTSRSPGPAPPMGRRAHPRLDQ